MTTLTEAQFRILCELANGDGYMCNPGLSTMERMQRAGLIRRAPADPGARPWSGARWELTEAGRSLFEQKGRELAKPGAGSLVAPEKRAILEEEAYQEKDRRRLVFDRARSVALLAVSVVAITRKEFTRLAGSPFPEVRAAALDKGYAFLADCGDLGRVLDPYLAHGDETTIAHVIRALRSAGRTDFLDEALIGRLRPKMLDNALLVMLHNNGVEVSDEFIRDLLRTGDMKTIAAVSELYVDRLDAREIECILRHGPVGARLDIAQRGRGLTARHLELIRQDAEPMVRTLADERLDRLARDLQAVENDPAMLSALHDRGAGLSEH